MCFDSDAVSILCVGVPQTRGTRLRMVFVCFRFSNLREGALRVCQFLFKRFWSCNKRGVKLVCFCFALHLGADTYRGVGGVEKGPRRDCPCLWVPTLFVVSAGSRAVVFDD